MAELSKGKRTNNLSTQNNIIDRAILAAQVLVLYFDVANKEELLE